MPARAVQDPFCGDVQLIWARGTGVDPNNDGDEEFARVNAQLTSRLDSAIYQTSYQLGFDGGFGGFAYPAAGDGFALVFNWIMPVIGEYRDSVQEGISELTAYMNYRTAECPGEVFVLAGLSQGAEVVREGLFQLSSSIQDRIAYVALFGDPTFSHSNTQFQTYSSCWSPKAPWVRGTSECWANGVFGAAAPYAPEGMEDRIGSWCRDGDGACTGIGLDILQTTPPDGQHYRYFEEKGDGDMAMREAAESLKSYIPDQANDIDATFLHFASGSAGADLAFIFDTTGSMFEEIDSAKAQATALASLWLSLTTNGRVALVEFRDQGDSFVSRVDLQFTNDGSAFQAAVNNLVADEGGDYPEAQLYGVMTALDNLAWHDGATKVGIVITDAPGKDPEPVTGYTRVQVGQHALEIDPVAIYGVDVAGDPEVTGFMQPLAAATAGDVFTLPPGQSLYDLLDDVINAVALSPVADLDGPYFALTGQPVYFTAAQSFDPDAAVVSYEWDFNGDLTADQTTTTPTVEHTYPAAYSGLAAVRVISADGGQALAAAQVTVDNGGFVNLAPLDPSNVTASITGPDEVTVTWTPTATDHADGYKIAAYDNRLMRWVDAGSANSVAVTGLDLAQPITFSVRTSNTYGDSPGVGAPPVGGTSGWSPIVRVNADDSVNQIAPVVAMGSDDTAYAAWIHGWLGPDNDLYFSLRDPTTGAWASQQRINDVTAGDQFDPAIAVDGAGNVYAVWADERVSGDRNIYFSKRSAATGT